MGRLQHEVFRFVDERLFFLGKLAPEQEDDVCFLRDILLMTASVNSAQPIFEWLIGSLARTVSEALSRSTPCSAQWVRLP